MTISKGVLWLDDVRTPLLIPGAVGGLWIARNYQEFVKFIEQMEVMPELVCFDHDLSFEHYPLAEHRPGEVIPYNTYREKTGYHCAQYLVDNDYPINKWSVHSFNPIGRKNIEDLLRSYCPDGEVRGLNIPYKTEGC